MTETTITSSYSAEKENANVGLWGRLKNFFTSNMSLTGIIAAALLLLVSWGIMYYSAQDAIRHTMEKMVDRETNSIYLTIHNKLSKVEVIIDNYAWVVSGDLENPDWMFETTRKLVKNNPSIVGCNITFIPYYYPKKGRWFEPIAVQQRS